MPRPPLAREPNDPSLRSGDAPLPLVAPLCVARSARSAVVMFDLFFVIVLFFFFFLSSLLFSLLLFYCFIVVISDCCLFFSFLYSSHSEKFFKIKKRKEDN